MYPSGVSEKSWLKFESREVSENLLLEPPSLDDQLEADWGMLRGKTPKGRLPRMDDAQLKAFILGVLEGRVFTTRHIKFRSHLECSKCDLRFPQAEDLRTCVECQGPLVARSEPDIELQLVFLPLAFGALGTLDESELANIGGCWANYADALPRSINGYPMFMTMGMLHTLDWERAWRVIDRELARREALDLGNGLDESSEEGGVSR